MGNQLSITAMHAAQMEAAEVGPEIGELIGFLNDCPTAFHAVGNSLAPALSLLLFRGKTPEEKKKK
jgi:hypothetical protein